MKGQSIISPNARRPSRSKKPPRGWDAPAMAVSPAKQALNDFCRVQRQAMKPLQPGFEAMRRQARETVKALKADWEGH